LTADPDQERRAAKPGGRVRRRLAVAAAFVTALLLAIFAVVRLGPLTDTGRSWIVTRLEGVPVGPLGRLHVSGLRGDVWHDFTLDRLSIADAGGTWFEARGLHVRWRPSRLLRRRVHAQLLQIDSLTLSRRPTLSPAKPGGSAGGLPVSIFIDDLGVRLETAPAFSVVRGLFQIRMNVDIARKGGVAGSIRSQNLLQSGDGMEARFDLGVGRKVLLEGRAHESRGGALAGMLGLPVSKAVLIDAKAGGDVVAGSSHILAYSGTTLIAQADGVWTKAGGGMQGTLALDASSWTAPLMRALGPRLLFSVQHTQVRGSLRDLVVRLQSDNAALSIVGPVDIAHRRSDQGLTVNASAKDLSRLIAQPTMGGGHFAGVWKGRDLDWNLTGQAAVQRLVLGAYALADASGPVRVIFHAGELRLIADANGTGGQGSGLVGALAGPKPQASLDASRLADGRLLLRALKLSGAGVKLDATGGIGLLGDLNFKGGAQLTRLDAARAGAKGSIAARWTASQFRARQPWKLTADLTGSSLILGQPEIDHLLGEKPRLNLQGSVDNGAVNLTKSELDGAGLRLGAKGVISRERVLKLALDWTGDGPLAIGPVGLGGRFRGNGVITGALSAPQVALSGDFDRLSVADLATNDAHASVDASLGAEGAGGKVSLTAASAYGPAHLRSDFRYGGGRLDLTALDMVAGGLTGRGALGLRDWALDAGDLTLSAGPGLLLDQGRLDAQLKLTSEAGGPIASLNLTGSNLKSKGDAAVIRDVKLTANGPLSRLTYAVQTDVDADQAPLSLAGQGVASDTGSGRTLTFSGSGRFRSTDFHTLNPADLTFDGQDRSAQLDLSVGGGRAQIKARQVGGSLSGAAALTGIDLATLGEGLTGRADADLTFNGQGDQLAGQLTAKLKGARSRDAPSKLALDGSVSAALADGRLTVDAAVDGAMTKDHATLHAVIPASAAASPFRLEIERNQPISGDLAAQGDLQPIWDLFFGGERELGGQLNANVHLAGDLASPRFTGHAAVSQGLFEDAATGLKLRDLSAEADLQNDALVLDRFNAKDPRSGVLTGSGRLSLARNGDSTLTLTAKGFQLLDNETAKATASGAVTVVRGADGKARLSGALVLDRADIQAAAARGPPGVVTMDVIERNKPGGGGQSLRPPPAVGPALALDVKITAPRHIYVKGLGLDAELSLDAQVVGDTSAPVLQGKARVVRGIYDFAGKRFDIDDTGVIDLAASPDQIRLDLTATLTDPTLTAVIAIKGTAAKPAITLSSTPVLPSDEILSQVLFGQSAAQLSPVQAAQLAAAVTTLATGGGFDVMGGLGKLARLDRIALGGTSATGVTVSGGKYIGNNVYLEVTGGGRQGPSAQVEVRATRSLSLISQLGGDVGAKLSIRWRKDYGKVAAGK